MGYKRKSLNILVLLTAVFILISLFFIIFFHNKRINTNNKIIFEVKTSNNSLSSSNVESITSYTQNIVEIPKKDIKILVVGDVMLARTIGQLIKNGKDPFINVSNFFKEYDLVVANLETNISRAGIGDPKPGKLYTFNAPIESIKSLKNSGISMVSLANNHTMDYGTNALIDEMQNLNNGSVKYFGAGKNISEAFSAKNIILADTTISFIGVNDIENWITKVGINSPGSAYFDINQISNSIQNAKKVSDVVIALPHWGIEYNLSFTDRQNLLGKELIDNGVDIVIGSHPHVMEPSITYKNKMVYYSMGNFVFDEMPLITNADKGYMVEIVIRDKKIISSKKINIRLNSYGFPSLVDSQN